MIRRRPIVLFNLSFLDCICCGFGAIILLFVLTIGSQNLSMRDIFERLQRIMAAQLSQMAQVTTRKEQLQRETTTVTARLVEVRKENSTLTRMLDDLEKQLQNQKKGQDLLLVDIDDLRKEIAARQKKPEQLLKDVKPTPVGLPVGSTNYLAFVIDTSGSMRDPATDRIWAAVIQKIDDVLDAYPQIEGIQVLDADGRFILGRGSEQWLADSPEIRSGIKQAVRRYDVATNSNPVPGIFRALRTLHDPKDDKMKMGIFIFGDEFTGTADAVIKRLDELNPADEKGNRKVAINAVGFPTTIRFQFSMGNTGLKFSNLMREVTYQHGGAFIALQDL